MTLLKVSRAKSCLTCFVPEKISQRKLFMPCFLVIHFSWIAQCDSADHQTFILRDEGLIQAVVR